MKNVPDAIFVIDTRKESIAVQEARKLKIPVIGIVDTNCDPDEVDHVIPGNDDALRAIKLFAGRIADAVLAGRGIRESRAAEAAAGQGRGQGRGRRGAAPAQDAADGDAGADGITAAPRPRTSRGPLSRGPRLFRMETEKQWQTLQQRWCASSVRRRAPA